jgi:hypothetical protein
MEVPLRFGYAAVLACGLALLAAPQKSGKPELALQKAIQTETVDGDLKSAIEQYKKIAQGRDHALAAKALVRMGECYEKLGDAEARKAYQRVVSEFGDQKDSAEAARARLAAMGKTDAGPTTRLVDKDGRFVGASPDGKALLQSGADGDLEVKELKTGRIRHITNRRNRDTDGLSLSTVHRTARHNFRAASARRASTRTAANSSIQRVAETETAPERQTGCWRTSCPRRPSRRRRTSALQLQQPLQNRLNLAEGRGRQPADSALCAKAADVGLANLIALDPARLGQASFTGRNVHMNPQRRAGTRDRDDDQHSKRTFVEVVGGNHQRRVLIADFVSD